MFATFAALIVFAVFGMMKSSEPYKLALSKAQANAVVQQRLGTPIEPGLFVTGNINVSGSSGAADFSIPISGPQGKAAIYVDARRSQGQWTFSSLVVGFKEGGRVDLLAEKAEVQSSISGQ